MPKSGEYIIIISELNRECERFLKELQFNEQYDRIESMMFVNTVVTDDDGVPLTDPKTGEFLVENDGCD